MDRLNPWKIGIAAAITSSITYTVCAVAVDLFPEASITFFNAWFHGLDLSLIRAHKPDLVGVFIYGLVGVAVTAFFVATIYATVYNLVSFGARRDQLREDRLTH
jgi:hypothetical protein